MVYNVDIQLYVKKIGVLDWRYVGGRTHVGKFDQTQRDIVPRVELA